MSRFLNFIRATKQLNASDNENRTFTRILLSAGLALSLLVSTTWAAPHQSLNSDKALDQQFKAVMDAIVLGHIVQARVLAKGLTLRFPDFALGQLLLSDIARSHAFESISLYQEQAFNQELLQLLYEAKVRLGKAEGPEHIGSFPTADNTSFRPDSMLQRGNNVNQLIVVDLNNSQLNLFAGSASLTHLEQHYIGMGKAGFGKEIEGDNKTPVGIYRVVNKLSDAELPTLYGTGALTLNYPNNLDQYLGRTGYGIWLHGVPHHQMSRSPLSSEGCVTMSNDHLTNLYQRIKPDQTVVLLGDHITNAPPNEDQIKATRTLFKQYQQSQLEKHGQTSGIRESWLKAFAEIQLDQLTIIRHPTLEGHLSLQQKDDLIHISTLFGDNNEHAIELDWALHSDGNWELITEKWVIDFNYQTAL